MEVQYIQECVCGAMTITFYNGVSNSMTKEKFNSIGFIGEKLPTVFCCCNHCVNHWGIDLCGCGSGKLVGQCECRSQQASEELGTERTFIGWAF